MQKHTKWICLILTMVMALALFGCKRDESVGGSSGGRGNVVAKDMKSYLGTWQADDHDVENVVHYLIFDEDGYWYVHMDRASLSRAIAQRDQYVSFLVTFEGDADKGKKPLNVSAHTGCYYEFVEYGADEFSMDEDGNVIFETATGVVFTRVSEETGEPSQIVVGQDGKATVLDQAKELFDLAREDALNK